MRNGLIVTLTLTVVGAAGVSAAAWTAAEMRASVLDWGDGFVDQPMRKPPPPTVLDWPLSFEIDALGSSRPDALTRPMDRHMAWWVTHAQPRIIFGQTWADGSRQVTYTGVSSQKPALGRIRLSRRAFPVACPDPAESRRCYHVGLRETGRAESHFALTIDLRADEVSLYAEGIALVEEGAIFLTVGGPLFNLHGLPATEALAHLADSVDAPRPAKEARWSLEGWSTMRAHLAKNVLVAPTRSQPPETPSFIGDWRARNLR